MATSTPTTYQRRYIICCKALGEEPGQVEGREYMLWITRRLSDYRRIKGYHRDRRLTKQDQEEFDDYLDEWIKGEK